MFVSWVLVIMPIKPLQSTTGAIAGTPTDVMEPVSRLIESAGIIKRAGTITVYRTASRESDMLIALVKEVVLELGAEKAVRLRVRPWRIFWLLAMLKGARRPPVLEINGNIFSQGTVPGREVLKSHLARELIR